MLEWFVKWFYGYLYIRLNGNSSERFVNLCNARKIRLWNIEKTEKGYGFYVSAEEFKGFIPIARKTKTRPYIVKRIGLPFHIKRIKPRRGLWIGGFMFFVLIYVYASFIWEICVLGQYSYTEEALLKYLKAIDVHAGMPRAKISCPDIEKSIREEYTDIGWVSAELKGSKLFVRIQETNMPMLYESDSKPRHLIAQRSGIVDSVITRTGTPLVKKGDIVEKGDILISGIVEIYGDGGELLKKEAVRADGDVIIKAETSYFNEMSKKYFQKNDIDENITYEIQILTYYIRPLPFWDALTEWVQTGVEMLSKKENNRKNGEDNGSEGELFWEKGKDVLVEHKRICLNKSLSLPICIRKKITRQYTLLQQQYTQEDIEKILWEKFDYYLKKLSEKGVIIGENSVRIVTSESFGTISGTFVIYEKSDKFQKILDDEWRIVESDEYSRNNN